MSANTTAPTTSTFTTPPTTIPTSEPPPPTTDTSTSQPPPSSDPTTTTSTTTTPPPVTTTTTSSSLPPTTTTTTTFSSSSPTTIPTVVTTITVPPTGTNPPETITQTLTRDPTTTVPPTSSSQSPSSTAIIIGSNGNDNGRGLPASGVIAIAVVIPVVVVAILLALGFFFWKKRKARKVAEEQRKDEMAEYGFNPNNDPSLFPVGAAAYQDGHSEAADDNSGYRGWGTTNSNARKPSTTLGSNSRAGAMGMGFSDNASQPSGYAYGSPATTAAAANGASDPLMGNQEHTDEVAALGAAGVKNSRSSQVEIQRGVSNASSSYSRGAPQSESSAEGAYSSPHYHEDVPYNVFNDGSNSHGPYGDGTYSNDQPIIRDVSARRNTKIERAPTFPQTQGGISQNF